MRLGFAAGGGGAAELSEALGLALVLGFVGEPLPRHGREPHPPMILLPSGAFKDKSEFLSTAILICYFHASYGTFHIPENICDEECS